MALVATTSYLAHQENDLGRCVVQHKPLNKGIHAQLGLVKIWDDPGMRPKPLTRQLNSQHCFGSTDESPGARTKSALPSRGPAHTPAAVATVTSQPPPTAPPTKSSAWPWSSRDEVRDLMRPAMAVSQPLSSRGPQFQGTVRDNLSVADIDGAQKKMTSSSAASAGGRATGATSNAQGATERTQPRRAEFQTRTTALDVSDIVRARKKQMGAAAAAMAAAAPLPQQLEPQQQPQQPQQVQAAERQGQAASCNPARSSGPAGSPSLQQQHDGALHLIQQQQQARMDATERELAATRHVQRTTFGRSPSAAHRTRMRHATARHEAQRAAAHLLSSGALRASAPAALRGALKAADREGCGRVTVPELSHALDAAGVSRTPTQAAALVAGLQDNAGLVAYGEVVAALSRRDAAAEGLIGTAATGVAARAASAGPQQSKGSIPSSAAAAAASGAEAAAGPSASPSQRGGADFKGYHFWFGGADPDGSARQAAWMPRHDADGRKGVDEVSAHAAAAIAAVAAANAQAHHHSPFAAEYGHGDGSGGTQAAPAALVYRPPHVLDAPTTSSLLKSGKVTPDEVAKQLRAFSAPSAAGPVAPHESALQQRMFASTGTAGGLGATLKGTLVALGTGRLQAGITAQRHDGGGGSRPASAMPLQSQTGGGSRTGSAVGRPASALVVAVVNKSGGASQARTDAALLRAEIAAVRGLR